MAISRQRPRQRGERPLIFGRDPERAQLADLLADAAAGHGALVLISGEAGVGKSTLVNDLIHEAEEHGCLVLNGACYDLTTTPPYGPWSDALRGYTPQQGQPPVPGWFGDPDAMGKVGSQTALFDETRHFFMAIAEQQPLVIVLEDLHWADAASLEALRYLARTFEAIPILLVATYRDDEITRHHELYQLLPLLVRESQAQRLHLNRLDHDAIHEMVSVHYDLEKSDVEQLVEHVDERSQGNPFFAEEILQGLEADQLLRPVDDGWVLGHLDQAQMPVLLQQALEFRLRQLSSATRGALQVAAVIGQVVPIDRWQEITDLNGDTFEQVITEALATRVLEETTRPETLQFRHALLRETLYESLTLSRRRAWHRTVGEMLAEMPNADPEAVAHHFQSSGDPRAAHWLIQAGVRAEGSYALRVAASHHDAAQALLAADPDAAQARGWLLFHIGHLLRYSDRERSIAYLEDAAQVARQVDDPVLEAQSKATHGLLRCFQGDLGRGLSDKEDAIAIMDAVTEPQEQRARQAIAALFPRAMFADPSTTSGGSVFRIGLLPGVNTLIHTYVDLLALAGRFREAMRIGRAFVDQVTAATDDTLLIQSFCRDAYYGLSVASDWLGRPEEARHWRESALDAYEAIGHRAMVRAVRGDELFHLLTYEADRPARRRHTATATAVTIEGIADHQMGSGSAVLLDLIEGRWDRARALARSILEEHDPYAQYFRASIHRVLGHEQHDEEFTTAIQTDISNVLPDGSATEFGQKWVKSTVVLRQLAAELALDEGDLEIAREWITAHDHWLEWSGSVLGRSEASLLWARHHHLAGDAAAARQHARRALEHASDPRQPLAIIAAHRYLGQLAVEAERFDEVADHLQASLELAERCEAPYEQALTSLIMAELAFKQRKIDTANRLLREVRATCKSLGASRTLDRADQLQARLRDRAGHHPAGLSDREVEVLEQATTGMTNAEIGDVLYISRRTVAQHLRSVYNKLGVNNRAAAVARWVELKNI